MTTTRTTTISRSEDIDDIAVLSLIAVFLEITAAAFGPAWTQLFMSLLVAAQATAAAGMAVAAYRRRLMVTAGLILAATTVALAIFAR